MRKRSLSTLRREAASACRFRGHRMAWTLYREEPRGPFWYGRCRETGCAADVIVTADPDANGADVAGTGVALSCPVPWGQPAD